MSVALLLSFIRNFSSRSFSFDCDLRADYLKRGRLMPMTEIETLNAEVERLGRELQASQAQADNISKTLPISSLLL